MKPTKRSVYVVEDYPVDKDWIKNKRHVKTIKVPSFVCQSVFDDVMKVFNPTTVDMRENMLVTNIDALKDKNVGTLFLPSIAKRPITNNEKYVKPSFVIPTTVTNLELPILNRVQVDIICPEDHVFEKVCGIDAHLYPAFSLEITNNQVKTPSFFACVTEVEFMCDKLDLDLLQDSNIVKMSVCCDVVVGKFPPSLRYLLFPEMVSKDSYQKLKEQVYESELLFFTNYCYNYDDKPRRESTKKLTNEERKYFEKGMICFDGKRYRGNWNRHSTLLQHL
jgi:hypothetical protein